MRIGQDVSIEECRDSGYMVIEYDPENLITNGVMNKDVEVRATRSAPGGTEDDLVVDTHISWNEVERAYRERQADIDEFVDMKNCPIEMDDPSEYDLLTLIAVVDSYCGLP